MHLGRTLELSFQPFFLLPLFYFVSGHVLGKTKGRGLQCACIQARWTEEIKVSIEINGKLQLVPMHMGAVGRCSIELE